ncbi:NTP transferase domain-containing protein [Curtobacterium sp. 1P10AnD]|uniref:molybdenum cofactor guanylyltransferase n=1 Tax=Curtobacterium sp. 1P10AnD TaxID=3132283 RepID=UPI0039A211C6
MSDSSDFDAVLLAGGRATRLGGIDKTALGTAGSTLLDRALDASTGARRTVVVGLRDGTRAPAEVVLVREDPPFGGPVSGLAAALDAVPASAATTLVLACDLVRPVEAVAALRAGAAQDGPSSSTAADGWVAVDDDGRRQPLLAVYRSAALRRAVSALGEVDGASLRRLTAPLDLVEVPVPSALCADVDTPDDAERLT